MTTFDGALYAATLNMATGTELWRSINGTSWSQANADGFGSSANLLVYELFVMDGILYAGTFNWATGTEVWASVDGTSWVQVNPDGFGTSRNYGVVAMAEHDGWLYAGLRNPDGCQVWRFRPAVFADGFESGSLAAWSTWTP
jgi:outer membrane protein assembly factor BamB